MHDRNEDQPIELLSAVRAEADPVLWTRARARIEEQRPTGFIAWLMRPAALAASMAALVLSVSVSTFLVLHSQPKISANSLSDALISTPSTPIEEMSVPTTDALQPADSEATP